LRKILDHPMPTYALALVSELILLFTDRILSEDSPFLGCLYPCIAWLLLHKEDGLLEKVLGYSPLVKEDLIRVHGIASKHAEAELKKLKDEEEQLKFVELVGSTLISEEALLVGFLPLESYIEKRKSIKSGEKCPKEKEILARAIMLRDCLSEIGCSEGKEEEKKEEDTIMLSEKEGTTVDELFAELDSAHLVPHTKNPLEKPLIVVDAQNVAMRHGQRTFSTKGIQIVLEFWKKNGHPVVCFLPEYLFNYEEVAAKKKLTQMQIKDIKASQLPDNVALLHKLADLGMVVKTPGQDYDDSYCIQYARKNGGFIVTNDKFRDYLQKFDGTPDKKREAEWIKGHCISFAFNKDRFLPYPDSQLFDTFNYDAYKEYPLDEL